MNTYSIIQSSLQIKNAIKGSHSLHRDLDESLQNVTNILSTLEEKSNEHVQMSNNNYNALETILAPFTENIRLLFKGNMNAIHQY